MTPRQFSRLGHGTRVRHSTAEEGGIEGTIENHGIPIVVWDDGRYWPTAEHQQAHWLPSMEEIPLILPITSGEWAVFTRTAGIGQVEVRSVETKDVIAKIVTDKKSRDEVLGNAKLIAKAAAWKDLALRLARHVNNPDLLLATAWGSQGGNLLAEVQKLDPASYAEFVKSVKKH